MARHLALAQASISAAQTTVKRYESLVGKGVTDEELAADRALPSPWIVNFRYYLHAQSACL